MASARVWKTVHQTSSLFSVLKNVSTMALMLLYSSSGSRACYDASKTAAEMSVDLAGDEPFEAADDLALRQSFSEALAEIGECRRMTAHADDHDTVEGGVGLPIATAVQPVAGRHPAGGGDRTDPAQFRKSCL